jgi:hypothetical protein
VSRKKERFDSASHAQAAGIPSDAKEEACYTQRTTPDGVSKIYERVAAVLAAEVLRLQCLEPQKEK